MIEAVRSRIARVAAVLSLASVTIATGMSSAAIAEQTVVSTPAPKIDRRVAVTFDDLPGAAAAARSNAVADLAEQQRKLLASFRGAGVPVVGFANEGKLFVAGESESDAKAREGLLRMWAEAGFELGNHTYSHRSLNRTPLDEFQKDVSRGEAVTRRLMRDAGLPFRYFRHPFLQVGLELEKRRAFEAWLGKNGYTIAPVSMDNDEYIFAAVYADALRRRDFVRAKGTAEAYVTYMDSTFAFFEDVEQRLLGRPMSHVLLLHSNALNADHFTRVAESLRARGYRFVTLEEALRDEAWSRPDTYVGAWGLSWLHHWEITEGRKRSPSPDPPEWVTKAYEALGVR
jgi:peptidoglycan/xylan/chitin deacetylase (PgdA/CDA1 family)